MPPRESPKDPKALPATGDAPEAPPKKSRLKKIIIIVLILLITLACAGAGAYWWFMLRTPAPADGAPAPAAAAAGASKSQNGGAAPAKGEGSPRIERQSDLPRSGGLVLPLPEFTVNLTDPAGKRYLKLGMEVEVNADVSKSLQAQAPKVRDAVIMLLAGKSYADIASPEGKVLLKAEVASRLNQILGGPYVVRVYFTEFVVQ